MGIEWSAYKKVKENTLMICTAELTKENKEEIFLIYNMGKINPKIKKAYGADGFAIRKDQWSKKWILNWWNKLDDETFDEDEDLEIPNWEAKRVRLVDKWIIKIAEAQAVLEAESDSSEELPPVVKPKPKSSSKSKKSKKSKKKPIKRSEPVDDNSANSSDGGRRLPGPLRGQ